MPEKGNEFWRTCRSLPGIWKEEVFQAGGWYVEKKRECAEDQCSGNRKLLGQHARLRMTWTRREGKREGSENLPFLSIFQMLSWLMLDGQEAWGLDVSTGSLSEPFACSWLLSRCQTQAYRDCSHSYCHIFVEKTIPYAAQSSLHKETSR